MAETATNRLADEASAYLRQHMNNPVDWYPWGPEALERARGEDKPLLVSIGYSACHWCHVMERESFEDPETAALMNRYFVNVKVDREERPDVDQIYMDVVTGLTGHGGWPLTVFCTPDGAPFYGGTYFPPEPRHGLPAFRQLLEGIHDAWARRRGEVDASAAQVVEALGRTARGTAAETPGADSVARAAIQLLRSADAQHGGFGGAPKFPTPTSLAALLAAVDVLPERKAREALDHVVLSCREMARGGLYDQLGGGFHRYCVDAHWGVPHFEKMLYDQGQLLAIYAETWRRTRDDDLLWPIRETVEFLRREMGGPPGGFAASRDADSEGEEGRFYVWTPEEIEALLGAETAARFGSAYGVDERGNFEGGTSVLRDVARAPRAELAEERAALLAARGRRVAPGIDAKRVTAWNAVTATGLARAGSLLGDDAMLRDAVATLDFLLSGGRLRRIAGDPRAGDAVFLDDLAATLEAALELHRAGAGPRYLEAALALGDEIAARFYDADEGDLFLTPRDGERLVSRPRSDHDGATPHSAGWALLGLLRLASLAGRADLRELCDRVLRTQAFALERAPHALPTLARAALLAERGPSLALVLGDPRDAATRALADRARRVLAPEDAVLVLRPGDPAPAGVDGAWLAGREPVAGRPTAFVCRGVTCSLPVVEPGELEPLDEAHG